MIYHGLFCIFTMLLLLNCVLGHVALLGSKIRLVVKKRKDDCVSDHTWFIHQIHQTLSLVTIKFRHSERMLAKYLKREKIFV